MSTATAWQELTLIDLTEDAEAAFFGVIESVPTGRLFTVNDVRARLDAIEVPDKQRGALFNRALAAGLIEPLTVKSWGRTYDVRIPSTGRSAHGATVRVYRRLGHDQPAAREGGDES